MTTTPLLSLVIAAAMDADEAAEKVRPGWIPFLIVLALGGFVAFLYFSLRKQLNKIDIPDGGVPTKPDDKSEPPASK